MLLLLIVLLVILIFAVIAWIYFSASTSENYHFLLINRDPHTDQKYLVCVDRTGTHLNVRVDQYINGYKSALYTETLTDGSVPNEGLGEVPLLVQTPFVEIRNDPEGPILRIDSNLFSFKIDTVMHSPEGVIAKLKGHPQYYGYLLWTRGLDHFTRTLQTDDMGNLLIIQETSNEITHINPDVSPTGADMVLAGTPHASITYTLEN